MMTSKSLFSIWSFAKHRCLPNFTFRYRLLGDYRRCKGAAFKRCQADYSCHEHGAFFLQRPLACCVRTFGSSRESTPTGSILSELDYDQIAEDTLDSMAELFEELPEKFKTSDEFDVTLASGVLTVCIGDQHGTYVINKQAPNKQIWLSSPYSGPKRYDFISREWIYKHDGRSLHDLLTEEISHVYGAHIDFTKCSYGKDSS